MIRVVEVFKDNCLAKLVKVNVLLAMRIEVSLPFFVTPRIPTSQEKTWQTTRLQVLSTRREDSLHNAAQRASILLPRAQSLRDEILRLLLSPTRSERRDTASRVMVSACSADEGDAKERAPPSRLGPSISNHQPRLQKLKEGVSLMNRINKIRHI
jgi:hypothetical protein